MGCNSSQSAAPSRFTPLQARGVTSTPSNHTSITVEHQVPGSGGSSGVVVSGLDEAVFHPSNKCQAHSAGGNDTVATLGMTPSFRMIMASTNASTSTGRRSSMLPPADTSGLDWDSATPITGISFCDGAVTCAVTGPIVPVLCGQVESPIVSEPNHADTLSAAAVQPTTDAPTAVSRGEHTKHKECVAARLTVAPPRSCLYAQESVNLLEPGHNNNTGGGDGDGESDSDGVGVGGDQQGWNTHLAMQAQLHCIRGIGGCMSGGSVHETPILLPTNVGPPALPMAAAGHHGMDSAAGQAVAATATLKSLSVRPPAAPLPRRNRTHTRTASNRAAQPAGVVGLPHVVGQRSTTVAAPLVWDAATGVIEPAVCAATAMEPPPSQVPLDSNTRHVRNQAVVPVTPVDNSAKPSNKPGNGVMPPSPPPASGGYDFDFNRYSKKEPISARKSYNRDHDLMYHRSSTTGTTLSAVGC